MDEIKFVTKISEKIRQARINAGLTQREIAEQVGMKYQSYQKYELSKRLPRIDKLALIAEACNVPLDYFVLDDVSIQDNWEKFKKTIDSQ